MTLGARSVAGPLSSPAGSVFSGTAPSSVRLTGRPARAAGKSKSRHSARSKKAARNGSRPPAIAMGRAKKMVFRIWCYWRPGGRYLRVQQTAAAIGARPHPHVRHLLKRNKGGGRQHLLGF